MQIVFDHTIIPSLDKKKSAEFYERIFGFEDMGELRGEGLRGIRINPTAVLFLEKSTGSGSSPWSQGTHHFAFGMGGKEFDQVFSNIKSSRIPYGDSYKDPANMKGPGKAPGAKGSGKTIYFLDPSENLVQILTY